MTNTKISKTSQTIEEWRDIKGYEGLYQVSNLGRIKALAKIDTGGKCWPEKILSPIKQHSGYYHVGLWWGGQCKQSRVHRLVAEAFIPNPDGKGQVNHLNEDKSDNRARNLEWATARENTNYGQCIAKRKRGRMKAVVRGDGKYYESITEALKDLGASLRDGHISQCCKGKQHTAYGYCWRYA